MEFFENVAQILSSARENAKTAVNVTMVYAYFTKPMYQIRLAKQCLANSKIFLLWETEENFA